MTTLRLPSSPSFFWSRLVGVAAFGAAGAALASVFLVAGVPTWFVFANAAAVALCGALVVMPRLHFVWLILASIAVTLLEHRVVSSGTSRSPPLDDDFTSPMAFFLEAVFVVFVSCIWTFGFAAARRVFRRVQATPSLDAMDRVLSAAVLGLALVVGGVWVWCSRDFTLRLGGDATVATQGVVIALGVVAAAIVLARDLQRYRFLRTLYEGRAPDWERLPRDAAGQAEGPTLIRCLGGCNDDDAILVRTREPDGLYRASAAPRSTARIPREFRGVAWTLGPRMALCAMLLLGQGVVGASLLREFRPPLTGVVGLAAGERRFCALKQDGSVLCWGSNVCGSLGVDGFNNAESPLPVRVTGLDDAVQIVGSDRSTCALRRNGQVVCWGCVIEDYTRAGPLTLPLRSDPVPGLPPARWIAWNGKRGCAITKKAIVPCSAHDPSRNCTPSDDTIVCWDRQGVRGSGIRVKLGVEIPDLLVASWGGCVRGADGVLCWGPGEADPTAEGPPCFSHGSEAPDGAEDSRYGRCESTVLGRFRCMGEEWEPSRRCVDVSNGPNSKEPARVTIEGDAKSQCVLDPDGRVRCAAWAETPPTEYNSAFRQLDLEHVVAFVSSGRGSWPGEHDYCALRADGTVWSWGSPNAYGALGDGTLRASETPVEVRSSHP